MTPEGEMHGSGWLSPSPGSPLDQTLLTSIFHVLRHHRHLLLLQFRRRQGSMSLEGSIYSKENSISFQALGKILKPTLRDWQWHLCVHIYCISFAMEQYNIYNRSLVSIFKKENVSELWWAQCLDEGMTSSGL